MKPINKRFYIEDYFPSECYPREKVKLDGIAAPPLYKDLKSMGGVANNIKKEIERNYAHYGKDKYQTFKPLLDKLLNIFDLDRT